MTRYVQFSALSETLLDNLLTEFAWAFENGDSVLRYAFTDRPADYLIDSELGYNPSLSAWNLPYRAGFSALTEPQQQSVAALLVQLESLINVKFEYAEDPKQATLRFGVTDLARENTSFVAFPPAPDLLPFTVDYDEIHLSAGIAGDIWLDNSLQTSSFLDALLAATGIALGLSAPGNDGFTVSGGGVIGGGAEALSGAQNSAANTVLADSPGVQNEPLNATFMSLDVRALQYLYGKSAVREDNLYIINGSVGNFLTPDNLSYSDGLASTVYLESYINLADAGGRDVLVFNVDKNLTVDLRPDGRSGSAEPLSVFIQAGTFIEELVTVDGDDTIYGTAFDNTISSRDGDDVVYGGGGSDLVFLDGGDDTYVYEAGSDTVHGGSGSDTFEISAESVSQLKFIQGSEEGKGAELLIVNTLDRAQTVVLDFEFVRLLGSTVPIENVLTTIIAFNADADLFVDAGPLYLSGIQSGDGAVSFEEAQLYRLYFGSFGRVPDQGGFDFWIEQLQSGVYDLAAVAEIFVASEEFITLADTNNSGNVGAEEFVTYMYTNVFGREPDPEGFDFWVDQLFSLEHTQGSAFTSMAQSDEFILLTASTVSDFLFA